MPQKVKFQSPFGTARYPHISKPDTVGKYADNKYKVKLVAAIDDKAALAFVQQIKDAATQIHGAKGLKLHMPFVIDEDANEIVFTFKTQYAPAIFDSKGRPVKGERVGGGSVLRVAGSFVEFDKGISAQFNQVQIKELNGFGSCAFDAVEDGYEFDGSSASDDEDDETTTNDEAKGNAALDI